jgi:hypothetical protein
MKITTNQYGFVYKNRGKYTRYPYMNETFPTLSLAKTAMENETPGIKQKTKLVRLVLETIE